MAPLPQWSADERFTGFWGGSSTAVAASSKQQAQAAKFAKWMNTDPEALKVLVEIGLYPSATAGQTSGGLGAAPDYMASQTDYYESAAAIAQTARGFSSWGPNTNVTYGALEDLMPTAVKEKSDFAAVATKVQELSLADLKKQGYEVSGG
jgi:multiple sugar transport system substrate-binding protein